MTKLTDREHGYLETILLMDRVEGETIPVVLTNLIELDVQSGDYVTPVSVSDSVTNILENAPQFVKHLIHIEMIESTTGVTTLWGGFYRSLLDNLGYTDMREQGQGLNKKMFKLLDRFLKTGIESVTIPNKFISESFDWTLPEITLINMKDFDQVTTLVRDIEVNGLEVV